MDKDQLFDLLRENLSIQIRVGHLEAYDSTQYVRVTIFFDGQEITEDYASLPDCGR